MQAVSLREITSQTVHQVCRLKVRPDQDRFVATNAVSLAEALFASEAWYRAIYADEQIVGFVMLWDDTLNPKPPARPEICLWRLMVAAQHQGHGIGKQALAEIIRHVHGRPGIARFYSSFVPGELGPGKFYLAAGFSPTAAHAPRRRQPLRSNVRPRHEHPQRAGCVQSRVSWPRRQPRR